MNEETEVEDEGTEEYFAEPALIHDESCLIMDPEAFAEKFNADAIQMREGAMFVLDRDSHKWINVEDFGKPDAPKLKRVQ